MDDQLARDDVSSSDGSGGDSSAGKSNRLLLLTGVGVGAVVVLVLVIALVVSAVSGGGATTVRVSDFVSPPRTEAWTADHRLMTDASDGDYLYMNSATVAQDQALITWMEEDGESSGRLLELIDTRTGGSLWTLPWEHESFDFVGTSSAGPLIVSGSVNGVTVHFAIDRSSGMVISDTSSRGGTWTPGLITVGQPHRELLLGDVSPHFGGDILLQSDEGVGRFSPFDLENPRWFVERDDEASGPTSVGLRTLHYQGRTYSLDSGQPVPWNGSESASYVVLDGFMLSSDSGSRSVTGVDATTGAQLWRLDVDDSATALLVEDGMLIVASQSASTLAAVDLTTGVQVWSRSVELVGGRFAAMLPEIGAALLPLGPDPSYVTAVDLATGEDLYRMPVSEDGEWWKEFLGASANLIYVLNTKSGEVEATDIRTGLTLWTLGEVASESSYQVRILGGHFVATLGYGQASDYREHPALIGLRP